MGEGEGDWEAYGCGCEGYGDGVVGCRDGREGAGAAHCGGGRGARTAKTGARAGYPRGVALRWDVGWEACRCRVCRLRVGGAEVCAGVAAQGPQTVVRVAVVSREDGVGGLVDGAGGCGTLFDKGTDEVGGLPGRNL